MRAMKFKLLYLEADEIFNNTDNVEADLTEAPPEDEILADLRYRADCAGIIILEDEKESTSQCILGRECLRRRPSLSSIGNGSLFQFQDS